MPRIYNNAPNMPQCPKYVTMHQICKNAPICHHAPKGPYGALGEDPGGPRALSVGFLIKLMFKRARGAKREPQALPRPPRIVIFVNLNRNLIGKLGSYCKLTQPTGDLACPRGVTKSVLPRARYTKGV